MRLLVLRVENRQGDGPYFGGSRGGIDCVASRYRPMPGEDGLLKFPTGWVFGFSSESQVQSWFLNSDFPILGRNGFGVSKYEVAEQFVLKGRSQLVFDRSQAKRLFHQPF